MMFIALKEFANHCSASAACILQTRTQAQEKKGLVQVFTTSKWQSQDANAGSQLESVLCVLPLRLTVKEQQSSQGKKKKADGESRLEMSHYGR